MITEETIKTYNELKEKYPDTCVMIRDKNNIRIINDDAEKCADRLGLHMVKHRKPGFVRQSATFREHLMPIYCPALMEIFDGIMMAQEGACSSNEEALERLKEATKDLRIPSEFPQECDIRNGAAMYAVICPVSYDPIALIDVMYGEVTLSINNTCTKCADIQEAVNRLQTFFDSFTECN